MSNNRDLACIEIKKRIEDIHTSIGLKSFHRTPTTGVKVEEMPACFMNDGIDSIIKRPTRSVSAKGCTRDMEIIIEIVGSTNSGVLALCRSVRDAVLADVHPVYISGKPDVTTYIYEERMEGPVGYGLPGVEAIVLVIKLVYIDK